MSTTVGGTDYTKCFLVAAANPSQTTLLVTVPTTPFLVFDATHTYFYLTIVDSPSYDIDSVPPAQREIVQVTAYTTVSTGYELTVVRGITTTPQFWAAGSVGEVRPCNQWLEDLKGAGGGMVQAEYVTLATDAGLTSERVLTAGTNVTITDNGPKGTVVIDATGTMVQAEYVTLALSGGLTSERVLTAGSNITITDNGPNSTVVIASTAAGGGGTLQSEEFTASGTFTVPTGVTGIWITGIGAGGGGWGSATSSVRGGAGGGAGEHGTMLPLAVTPAGTVSVTIGAKGTGGASGGNVGNNGGTTIVGPYNFLGGFGGWASSGIPVGGSGGGAGGGEPGASAIGVLGTAESSYSFGGSSGGAGGGSGAVGFAGGGSGGFLTGGAGGAVVAVHAGGGGGGATPWGPGAAGGDGDAAGNSATASWYGSGGGGAGANTANAGGDGAPGYAVIFWIG